jgi:hypothetical protein
MKPRPSPLSEASQSALAMNSTRKSVFGVLFSVPVIVVLPLTAVARSGTFCRAFGIPAPSPSSWSFAVTPLSARSIPRSPLEWMEFWSTWLRVAPPVIDTPSSALLAMTLPAPASAPPTRTPSLWSRKTPWPPFQAEPYRTYRRR